VRRNIDHYNLDMIISLGYRVQSQVATRFRRWATELLHEYVQKGFAMDDDRLKEGGNQCDTLSGLQVCSRCLIHGSSGLRPSTTWRIPTGGTSFHTLHDRMNSF